MFLFKYLRGDLSEVDDLCFATLAVDLIALVGEAVTVAFIGQVIVDIITIAG
jgi:hypothetical protein